MGRTQSSGERRPRLNIWVARFWRCGRDITVLVCRCTETFCFTSNSTVKLRSSWSRIGRHLHCRLMMPCNSKNQLQACCFSWLASRTISLSISFSTSHRRPTSCNTSPCWPSSSIHVSCGVSWEKICRSACLLWPRHVSKAKGQGKPSLRCSPDTAWRCIFAFKSTDRCGCGKKSLRIAQVCDAIWTRYQTGYMNCLYIQIPRCLFLQLRHSPCHATFSDPRNRWWLKISAIRDCLWDCP